MMKRQWTVGIISMLICVAAIVINPSQTKAAGSSDADAYRAAFDAVYYYNNNPDVAAAVGNNAQALFNHYVTFGVREGRSASAYFNAQAYRARYTDLQSAYGDNLAAYCRHYEAYGKAEGRNASADGQATAPVSAQNQAQEEAGVQEEPEASVAVAEKCTVGQSANNSGNVIGTCSTNYDASIPRATNVAVAAERINGVVLQPGQSFSFSQTILPRTTANGYVEAPIFVSGKVGSGIGGGVCQVSSTLYAAMIDAGLPATERHPHSRQVDYLPAGYDAAIAGNYLDLRFTNIYSSALQIQASAVNGVVTVSLVLQ